ncbi:MAG: hypothetical protein WBS19_05005 [Candidatus Korobacteraceae bacterium]
MNSTDFLLSVIDAFGGDVAGRTLLQKRAYFVSLLSGVDPGLRFDAHFYGPYSPTVDNTLGRLKALGFVNEEDTGFGTAPNGFEIKRYDYKLTDDGASVASRIKGSAEYQTIRAAADRIIEAGNPNYITLSIAAKAYFILNKREKGMSRDEIAAEATKFDWKLSPASLNSAVQFLERLGLVQVGGADR